MSSALRIVICGGPRVGKTRLSERLAGAACKARHTDDLIGALHPEDKAADWSACSAEVVKWFAEPGPWVIEGVAAVRALRKWLEANHGAPCDAVYWSSQPLQPLTKGQSAMLRGCESIWAPVRQELTMRGVPIHYF